MKSEERVLFVSTASLAKALGLTREAVWQWVRQGKVKAVCVQALNSDQASEVAYKTTRGRWFIPVSEVERLIASAYAGDMEGRRVLRAIARRACGLPKRSTDSRPISIPGKPRGEL